MIDGLIFLIVKFEYFFYFQTRQANIFYFVVVLELYTKHNSAIDFVFGAFVPFQCISMQLLGTPNLRNDEITEIASYRKSVKTRFGPILGFELGSEPTVW